MICFVFKRTRRIDGQRRESRDWFGALRMEWENTTRKWSLHTPDYREAQRLLQAERVLIEKRHHGLVPPAAMTEARERPLNAILDAFLLDRELDGKAGTTVRKYRNLRVLFERCGWKKIADVTPASFKAWRKGSPLARRSKDDLLKNTRRFFHWMQKERMVPRDCEPLADVSCLPPVGDERKRRAASHDEQERLLAAVAAVSRERFAVYLTAVRTGLRRCELRALVVEDFDFDTPSPIVRVRASIAKNNKDATIPLRPEVVDAVRAILPDNAMPFAKVFRYIPRIRTLKKDLARAKISFETAEGRLDFHSLRATFITNLQSVCDMPRVVMELARHSDIRLTMKVYTDAARLPLAAAVASLPAFKLPSAGMYGKADGVAAVS